MIDFSPMNALLDIRNHTNYQSYGVIDRFKFSLDVFTQFLARSGMQVVGYREETFRRLLDQHPMERWQVAQQEFEKVYLSYMQYTMHGGDLSLSVKLLKYVLKDLGWRTTEDVWENLEDSDVIEIYDPQFAQLFANLRFIAICSYELIEMRMGEWPQLFSRPASITNTIVDTVVKVLEKKGEFCTQTNVPEHYLEETHSPRLNVFRIRQKIVAPVYKGPNQLVGFLANLEATPLGSKADSDSNVILLQ